MWDMSSCDYEPWRDYEILIMQPILENVPRFQIFTVLIMTVSTEGKRMTGNHTDSLHCTKPETRTCLLQLNNWAPLCCLWYVLCTSSVDVCFYLRDTCFCKGTIFYWMFWRFSLMPSGHVRKAIWMKNSAGISLEPLLLHFSFLFPPRIFPHLLLRSYVPIC